jgi:hypothetical protein
MEPSAFPQFRAQLRGELLTLAVLALLAAIAAILVPSGTATRPGADWPLLHTAALTSDGALVTVVRDSEEASVEFSVGGYRGDDLFLSGMPSSVAVACSTSAVLTGQGHGVASKGTLSYDTGSATYTYRWMIPENWEGTCRRLSLGFSDGTVRLLLFRFEHPDGWNRSGRCGMPEFETTSFRRRFAVAPDRLRSC